MRKIGIDCQKILSPEGNGAGIEHYVYHIVNALAAEDSRSVKLILFLQPDLQGSPVAKKLEEFTRTKIEFYPRDAIERQGWWPYTKYKKMSSYLQSYDLDILHGPANVTPLFYGGKTIVTVHDLIIYEHPEWFPGGISDWFWRRQVVPKSISNADKLIAVSKFTKQQIIDRFGINTKKIKVIYEGITTSESASGKDSKRFTEKKIKEPYILYIGTIEPRKNLVRAIKAFSQVSSSLPNLRFVIAGKKGWKLDEVFATVKELKLEERIIFTGYADDTTKAALYSRASAFVFPSLAEGFGLPVLDAMQSGVPVVTSKTTSLKEVAGEAAVKVDPYSIKSITDGIREIVTNQNLRQELIAKGKFQAAKFSWQKAATQTLQVYNEVINES